MRIDKTVKGEKFRFYVQPVLNTMTAKVRASVSGEEIICPISSDFKYVLLTEDFTEFISGVGRVKVGKLKLSKFQQREIKEYNENTL